MNQNGKALPLEHYRAVAADYVRITQNEGFHDVLKKLGEMYDQSPRTMGTRVKRARELGVLEPFSARNCSRCGQPMPREGLAIARLAAFAEDHAELTLTEAEQAEQNGHMELAGGLRSAARYFGAAVRSLNAAHAAGVREGARLYPR